MPEKLWSNHWGLIKDSYAQTRVSGFKVVLILVTSGNSHQKNTTSLHFIWRYLLMYIALTQTRCSGGKSWACHPARNDLTSTNVRNISLCLPACKRGGSWVTQVSTAEHAVTPPSPSCFDYSSYAAGIINTYTFPRYVWLPYITISVWPLAEWLCACFQSPLLWETFQSSNTFPAGRVTSSSCQKNRSPYLDRVLVLDSWLFPRGPCKCHTKDILQSMKLLIHKSMLLD